MDHRPENFYEYLENAHQYELRRNRLKIIGISSSVIISILLIGLIIFYPTDENLSGIEDNTLQSPPVKQYQPAKEELSNRYTYPSRQNLQITSSKSAFDDESQVDSKSLPPSAPSIAEGVDSAQLRGYQNRTRSFLINQPEEPFLITEVMPEFPGGKQSLETYISQHLQYPENTGSKKSTGNVYVRFTVRSTGEIDMPQIVRSLGNGFDQEAIRLIRNMPVWKPGLQNGNPVDVYYTLSIPFEP